MMGRVFTDLTVYSLIHEIVIVFTSLMLNLVHFTAKNAYFFIVCAVHSRGSRCWSSTFLIINSTVLCRFILVELNCIFHLINDHFQDIYGFC